MKNRITTFDNFNRELIDFGLPFKDADVNVWVIDYYKRDNQYFTKVEIEVNGKTEIFKTEITEEVFEKRENTLAMKDTINAHFDELIELYESAKEIVEKTITFWDKVKTFFKRLIKIMKK